MANMESIIPYTSISYLDLLTALLVIVIGFVIVKMIVRIISKKTIGITGEALVEQFIIRIVSILLYIIVIIVALSALGYSMGSLVISLSAVIGLVLGFGMQDSVANVAAGVWLAVTHPMSKGDFVVVGDHTGTISAIGILATEILTPDNKFILIPNKSVWGSAIVNYSRMPTRRADIAVGIAYGTNVDTAVGVAMDIMHQNPAVLKDPEPKVLVTELADSSVNLELRFWVNNSDLVETSSDVKKNILMEYEKAGVEIPFPQMDVNMKN